MTQDDLTKKLLGQLQHLAREVSPRLSTHTVKNTRKLSGQARINTRMAVGSPNTKVTYAKVYAPNFFSDTRNRKEAEFKKLSKAIKLGDVVFTTSSLPYIDIIEHVYGDSMFAKAVQQFPYISEAVLREKS